MQNPYDLHSWSKYYREDVLREARKRDLVGGRRRIAKRADYGASSGFGGTRSPHSAPCRRRADTGQEVSLEH